MARNMKDSGIPWVGKIPEDWEVTRLKYLYSICPSLNITRDNLTETGCPVLSYGQIHSKKNSGYQINLDLVKYVPTTYTSPKALASKGDFLFADTSEDLEGCGNCIYVDSDFSVYAGAHVLFAKRRISNKENGRYLAFLFLSDAWRKQLRESVAGVKVYSVKKSMLSNAHILLPPITEQERIAEYLDKTVGRIDGLREKISCEIERLGDYKKSMISEAVCRGLDKTAKMKDSGIPWVGKIPAGWEVKKIKYCFKATNTRGNSCLQLLSATQKYGMYPQSKLEGVVQVAEKTDLSTFKTVHVDDFVISLRSFQGGIERSDYEGVCSPAYQTFHSTIECDTLYFKFLFKVQGFISALNAITVGIREGKSIYYGDVQNMYIPLPPLAEQKRIAEYIDKQVAKIDALIEKRKAEFERLEALKRSIICECVTGKMEVAS